MTKQEMVTRAKKIAAALDDLVEEIEGAEGINQFGLNRTIRDLGVARKLTMEVAQKLGEEATWNGTKIATRG